MAAVSQLYGRTPQPSRISLSYVVTMRCVPKLRLPSRPHSPLIAGAKKSHSGMKFPLRSVHVLFTLLTVVLTGLLEFASARKDPKLTYRFNDTLTAVLPVPKRS